MGLLLRTFALVAAGIVTIALGVYLIPRPGPGLSIVGVGCVALFFAWHGVRNRRR